MPAKTLIVQKSARKRLLKLPVSVHKRIIYALETIKENPLSGSKLRGELKDYFKYRVGDYRIVYIFERKSESVIVVKIEHRRGVYR